MAISSADYYSADITAPTSWHNYSDCPSGQQILRENLRWGRPSGYTRCGHCKNMD